MPLLSLVEKCLENFPVLFVKVLDLDDGVSASVVIVEYLAESVHVLAREVFMKSFVEHLGSHSLVDTKDGQGLR